MKKNKIFLKLLILVIIILGLKLILNPSTQAPVEEKKESVSYSTDFYEIELKYPNEELDKDELMKNFVISLAESRQEDWEEGGEMYEKEKELLEEFPERAEMKYSLYIDYEKFEAESLGTVSYLFKIGEYTGGANGREMVRSFSFNQDGLVDLDDILNYSDYILDENGLSVQNDIAISKLIFNKTKDSEELFPNEEIVLDGLGLSYLKEDGISLDHEKCNCDGWFFGSNLQNFVIQEDGLSFFFDKCEITICASGSVDVFLSWEELAPFLIFNKNGENNLSLSKKTWSLTLAKEGGEEIRFNRPEAFSLEFRDDLGFSFTTDCNGGGGRYKISADKLELSQPIKTLMFCEGSQEDEFIGHLIQMDSYTLSSDGLFLENKELGLEMQFE